jgi:hypothetical protein
MRGDGGIEQGLSSGLEVSQYAFFVGTHQAAVSGDAARIAASRRSTRLSAKTAPVIR